MKCQQMRIVDEVSSLALLRRLFRQSWAQLFSSQPYYQLHLDGKGTLFYSSRILGSSILLRRGWPLDSLPSVKRMANVVENHPAQVAKHTSSSADYYHLEDRLETFVRRYEDVNLAGKEREDALKELEDISESEKKVRGDSLPLTDRAYAHADALIGQ